MHAVQHFSWPGGRHMTTANAHVRSTYLRKDRPEYMPWLRELSIMLHVIYLDYKVICLSACICNQFEDWFEVCQ